MPGFYAEIPTSFYFASYSFFIKSPRFGLWKADFATSRLLDCHSKILRYGQDPSVFFEKKTEFNPATKQNIEKTMEV